MPDTTTMSQVRQKYKWLISDMIQWRDATNLYSRGHKKRWDRALAALNEPTGEPALTSLEAQAFADRGWKRWERVVVAIKEMEQARGYEKQVRTEVYKQLAEGNTKPTAKPKFEGSRKAPQPTDPSVSSATSRNNAPDYKADYKEACKVINDLRSELSKTKQEKYTARKRLASAEKYGARQFERAEKLESRLKAAGTVSDAQYQRAVNTYESLRRDHNKMKHELYELKDGKITFEQMVRAVMDDQIINMEILTEGAKHLTPDDRRILRDHIIDIDNAMEDIDTWLWDITHVPAGIIGKKYKGKAYNQDMASMLDLVDTITHQAWQTMQVVRTLGRKMEAAK